MMLSSGNNGRKTWAHARELGPRSALTGCRVFEVSTATPAHFDRMRVLVQVSLVIAASLLFSGCSGQPDPRSLWTVRWGKDLSYQDVTHLAGGPDGGIYVSGAFHGEADLDPGPGRCILRPTSSGEFEPSCFVSKFDAQGSFLWARGLEGRGFVYPKDVVSDHLGNVYLSGYYEGTIEISPTGGGHRDTSAQPSGSVVAKFDTNGNSEWTRALNRVVLSMAVDDGGNLYLTGSVEKEDFRQGFLSCHDRDGVLVWEKTFELAGGAVAVDSRGEIVTASSCFLVGSPLRINKWNPKGGLLWSMELQDNFGYMPDALAVDDDNNCVIVGHIPYDPRSPEPGRMFAMKLSRDGNLLWLKKWGGLCHVLDAATDPSRNVLITGSITGDFDFDPDTKGEMKRRPCGYEDPFVSIIGADGRIVNAVTWGDPRAYGWGGGIHCDEHGHVFVAGILAGAQFLSEFDEDGLTGF